MDCLFIANYVYLQRSKKWVDYLIKNEELPSELKQKIKKHKEAVENGIITKYELYKKLIPVGKEAETILNGNQEDMVRNINQKQKSKIKKAFEDGIISEEEMIQKIDELGNH